MSPGHMFYLNIYFSIWTLPLTLSWWRLLSYRNQSIYLLCKSMAWFLYHRDFCPERKISQWNIAGNVPDHRIFQEIKTENYNITSQHHNISHKKINKQKYPPWHETFHSTFYLKNITALDERKSKYIYRTNKTSKYCKRLQKFFSRKMDMLTYPKSFWKFPLFKF